MPSARLPNSLAYVESVSRAGRPRFGRRQMPAGSNWRRGGDYLQHLDRPGFAWEFLRRNPAYQEDYKTIVREDASDASFEGRSRDALVWRWGLAFCVDPKLSADQATVFWRASTLPTVVPLAPSPTSFIGARAIDFAEL